MNIRSLFLGNRSIRGTKRILPLSHLESVSQKIPLADQETDFDINDIGTRDARKVNVTISVCYAVMDRDGQKAEQEWSKIMSIPSRSSKFNQASRELELGADFMSKPEFWEKLYENLVKEEGTKIVRGMIYDNLDKLFIGNPVCPTFTHNVHARFRDLFESWGLDIKEVQFVNVDTVDEHMQGYGHVAQRERDTREHQIRLQVEAIDRIAEARANGIKRLESARAEAHANALEQMVSRVISVIKTEQGGHIAPEQVEAVVRSTLDELMLIRRLESGSNQRVDPMEHVGSNNN
jgi:regulator of protease activity HflC (stomatin/prohibitin superfamily)